MKPLYFLIACLFLSGCEQKETPQPANTASPATPTATPTASAPTAAAGDANDGEGIPTEEDFEDEAEQKITSQNADDELDKLEKEISN